MAFRFALPRIQRVKLELHDVFGRHVKTLAAGEFQTGRQEVRWDGHDEVGGVVGSGVYFARMSIGGRSAA